MSSNSDYEKQCAEYRRIEKLEDKRSKRIFAAVHAIMLEKHPEDAKLLASLYKRHYEFRAVGSIKDKTDDFAIEFHTQVYEAELWEAKLPFRFSSIWKYRNGDPSSDEVRRWMAKMKPFASKMQRLTKPLLDVGFVGHTVHERRDGKWYDDVDVDNEEITVIWAMTRSLGAGKGHQYVWLCYDRKAKKFGYTTTKRNLGRGYYDTDYDGWLSRATWVASVKPIVNALDKPRQKESEELNFIKGLTKEQIIKLLAGTLRPSEITRLANKAKKL